MHPRVAHAALLHHCLTAPLRCPQVPPLLPFNLGSLGFLTPFAPESLPDQLGSALRGGFPMILRHRLHCTIMRARCKTGLLANAPAAKWADAQCSSEYVVMNEVVIDRWVQLQCRLGG